MAAVAMSQLASVSVSAQSQTMCPNMQPMMGGWPRKNALSWDNTWLDLPKQVVSFLGGRKPLARSKMRIDGAWASARARQETSMMSLSGQVNERCQLIVMACSKLVSMQSCHQPY